MLKSPHIQSLFADVEIPTYDHCLLLFIVVIVSYGKEGKNAKLNINKKHSTCAAYKYDCCAICQHSYTTKTVPNNIV